MDYNQETQAMALINAAHKKHGLFTDSWNGPHGSIWMRFKFNSVIWHCKFNKYVYAGEMCKCMKLGNKGSNSIAVMI